MLDVNYIAKYRDQSIVDIGISVRYLYDRLYDEWWVHKISGQGLDKLNAYFEEPAEYSAFSAYEAVGSCKEYWKDISIDPGKVNKIEVSPDLQYYCKGNNCASAYFIKISFNATDNDNHDGKTAGYSCFVDANSMEVLNVVPHQWAGNSVEAEIYQLPYNYGDNLVVDGDTLSGSTPTSERMVPVGYASIWNAQGQIPQFVINTDELGIFANSCSQCYLMPSEMPNGERFTFITIIPRPIDDAWLGPWNSLNEPIKSFVFNVPPYTESPNHYWHYASVVQSHYLLNWIYDRINENDLARNIQYQDSNGSYRNWEYSTHISNGDNYYFRGGTMEYDYVDGSAGGYLYPAQPGFGSIFHEFGHGIDDINTLGVQKSFNEFGTTTNQDSWPVPGFNHHVDLCRHNESGTYRGLRIEAIARSMWIMCKMPGNRTFMNKSIDYYWVPGSSWFSNHRALIGTLHDIAWVLGWQNAMKALFGYDDGGDTSILLRRYIEPNPTSSVGKCDENTAYLTGFAKHDTYEYLAADIERCRCYNGNTTDGGTKCNNGLQACPNAEAIPQRTLLEHFGNKLHERINDNTSYWYEIDKTFKNRSQEIDIPANIDDMTDIIFRGPLLEPHKTLYKTGTYLYVIKKPDDNVSLLTTASNGSSINDYDNFTIYATWGETYQIAAMTMGHFVRLQLINDQGTILAQSGYGVNPSIVWTCGSGSGMGYYNVRVDPFPFGQGNYYIYMKNVNDDYPDYDPDSIPVALSRDPYSTDEKGNLGKLESLSDSDWFRIHIPPDIEFIANVNLELQVCSAVDTQKLQVTVWPAAAIRSSDGRWKKAGTSLPSYIVDGALWKCSNANWHTQSVGLPNSPLNKWFFIEIKAAVGSIGNGEYRFKVGTSPVHPSAPYDPVTICDRDNPKDNSCLWDVMNNLNDRNYIYRTAAFIDGNGLEAHEYILKVTEGRVVTINVTGLEYGNAFLNPKVEIHSVPYSQGGNGYNNDKTIRQSITETALNSYPIVEDDNSGIMVWGGSPDNSYGSDGNAFLHFTALRTQKYRIMISAENNTVGPYRLSVHVLRQSLAHPIMPAYLQE